MNKKQNKFVSFVLALGMVLSLLPFASADNFDSVHAATMETVNFALGKTVISSSNETDLLLAKYAVDGDDSTRWSSAFRDGEWIMVDLGAVYNVGCVNIQWEDAYASNYTISWSQDNVNWYDAVTKTIHSASKTTDMFYNRPVRYIKVTCNTRATQYGSSIYELEVMGNQIETTTEPATEETTTKAPSYTSTVTNFALGKTATASSSEDASLTPNFAFDGDDSTRWSSAWKDGEWIMVDLGSICTVGSIVIDWEAAYASNYTISWSQDNVTWYDAVNKSINSADKTTDMFYNRPVRYIKVTCNKRGTAYGASIYEIQVLGTKTEEVTEEPTTEEVILPTTNLALGKTVISSSNENDSLTANYAVDGDVSTRWSSAWKDGEWIMVDLGKLYAVGSVKINWEDAFAAAYTIQWSQDGTNWSTAVTYNAAQASEVNHMMYNRPIRYIKIIADRRATTYGASIYEIGVFGSAYNK